MGIYGNDLTAYSFGFLRRKEEGLDSPLNLCPCFSYGLSHLQDQGPCKLLSPLFQKLGGFHKQVAPFVGCKLCHLFCTLFGNFHRLEGFLLRSKAHLGNSLLSVGILYFH
jgi:hypothetical protein